MHQYRNIRLLLTPRFDAPKAEFMNHPARRNYQIFPLFKSCWYSVALALLWLASAPVGSASTMLLTLDGVTFGDGAVATGSFEFDPVSGFLGTYSIATTDGSTGLL